MVDKIIEGKRRKGRGLLVPDKKTVIQEEIQKVGLPYEMTQIDIGTLSYVSYRKKYSHEYLNRSWLVLWY